MRKRIIIIFTSLLLLVLLTGCGSNDNGIQQILNGTDSSFSFRLLSFPEIWYNFGIIAKRWVAVIMVACWLLCLGLRDIFKNNLEIQKWAVTVLGFKIPVVLFVLTYVYCKLYSAFNM